MYLPVIKKSPCAVIRRVILLTFYTACCQNQGGDFVCASADAKHPHPLYKTPAIGYNILKVPKHRKELPINTNWNDPNFQGFARQPRPKKEHKPVGTPLGRTLLNLAVTLVFAAIYYYVVLPPINLKSEEFYIFVLLCCAVYGVCAVLTSGFQGAGAKGYFDFLKKQCTVPLIVAAALAATALVGAVLGWQLFRAKDYRDLLTVQDGDFAAEVEEISYDQIPMLDAESAMKLGNRKLGELADMVSQFEVADDYTQINYQGRPVRVTPLRYGDLIKWLNNRSQGLPAYLIIDMVTQNVEVVRLDEGIRYTTAEHFGRNLNRHLRLRYPTFMFDDPAFEIDENGDPWWVCPRVSHTIGLFGGRDIIGAVLVNAVTGESTYYETGSVPNWVDHVYTADLIMQQYDYHGAYINGFINSLFGQRDVTVTTEGYNYIAIGDDVYMYTGVTSVVSDESNIGFILSNQRTKDTRFYLVAGAKEYSAMDSAHGSGPADEVHRYVPAAAEHLRPAHVLHGPEGRGPAGEDVRHGQRQPVPDRGHRRYRGGVRGQLPPHSGGEGPCLRR